MNAMLLAEGLEFSWTTILLHILNLVILVGGLWLLLYKPVKKMIKKRQKAMQDQVDENQKAKQEVEGMKSKYDELLSGVKQESAKASEEARIAAEQQKAHILEEAGRQAEEIVSHARTEIDKERQRAENELRAEAGELAAGIAAKLIGKTISAKDNEKLIEECLKEWGKDEKG